MRSLLFVPGDSERKLTRAMASGADALIIDLEDSVAPGAKSIARGMASDFLRAYPKPRVGPQLWVRLNAVASLEWHADMDAVITGAPDGVMLPKARNGEDVHHLSVAMELAEAAAGLEAGSTHIIALVTEVPSALLALDTFRASSSRLLGLAWGAEDLSAALGAVSSRDADGHLTSPFRLARDLTLFAAAAAEVAAIDEVHVDFRDLKGLARATAEAARDGFCGKMAIHPDQVPVINDAFTPTAEVIAEADAIVRLFADNAGLGVVSHEGRMLDRPHLIRAERIMARARLAAARAAAPIKAVE